MFLPAMFIMKTELEEIPGIGPALARDLKSVGIEKISDLRGRDPQKLYDKLCKLHGKQDRCVLYAFRCAVYYASGGKDKEKLKWWNWKD